MQESLELIITVHRITEMENNFDMLCKVWNEDKSCFQKNAYVKKKLKSLIHYYESGLWLEDFEKGEKGILPAGLKRGVLSEDGLYNFLSDVGPINNAENNRS